ncbi:MAG: AAA family ATPase [Bacteroidales bacterium]|nr:AAA family ATPase [Bacteroidales bacterium]
MSEIYQREALQNLREWKDKAERKPLILRGPRQVGKTTLVDIFSKDFESYVYLNLEIEENAKIFESNKNINEIITTIFFIGGKKINQTSSLLFIDEIQNSAQAVMMLRYFYEQAPWLYVISAGSLLENLEKKNVSFPVGRVEYMALRPFSFKEYAWANLGEDVYNAINSVSIPGAYHSKLIKEFNTYTLIGGMPEVVSNYIKYRDILKLNGIYDTLLTAYRDDIEKYAPRESITKAMRYIMEYGFPYACQEIVLGGFAGSAYKSREIGEAFSQLSKSMLVELVYPATSTEIPAPPDMKRRPKLLWLDTGIVNYASGLRKEILGANDILDVYKGKIAEHIVGQELISTDNRCSLRRSYWVRNKQGSDAEMDFTIQKDNKMIPIEVKAGTNAHLKSLHIYMDESDQNVAVRIWSNPMQIDEIKTPKGKTFKLINLPFYYVSKIHEILDKEM